MAETKNGIKYPDDYNSVADIPKDLKDMAESIDAQIANKVEKVDGKGLSTNDFTNTYKDKLDKLNNYDDTKIKKDISDIQKEQKTQNDDIETLKAEKEALEKEVQSLREDAKLNGLTEDNEGELVHIENTTGARFNSLEIFGNEKQDTREGRNLYNVRDTSGQAFNSSLKVAEDDTISLDNYTNTGTSTKWLDFRTNPETKLKANTLYYIVTEIFSVSGNGILGVVTTNADSMGQFAQGVTYHFEDLNAGDIKVATATTKEDLSACLTETRSYIQMNAGETGSIEFRISILEDEVTAEDFVYEKYGESPSFDYPSEVECVGDNKNVFNDEAYKGFVVTQQNYNSLEKVDLKLEPNKYYVAKIYFEDGTSVAVNNSNFMLYAYKADGTQSANIPNGIAKMYTNATKLVKAKIVANSTGLSTYANKVIAGIKIEEVADEDGQPSPYSNYNQGCIELNIINKNILDVPKNSTVTKAGMTVTTDTNGVLTLNGTTTSAIYIGLNKNNFIMQAGNLFERSMFRKGNYNFSVDNLSSTQTLNASAYIRKNYNSGEIVYLESVFSAKHRDKNFILEEDKEAIVYLWIASGITLNNAKLKFQIELDNATEIVSNKEQNYIIPVQQRMFSGDKFAKLDGKWKEMHTFKGTKLSEVSSWIKTDNSQKSDTILRFTTNFSDGKLAKYIRTSPRTFWSDKSECVYLLDAYKKECLAPHNGVTGQLNIFINKNRLTDETVEAFKQYLTQNEIIVYYKLAEPLYLDCTKGQTEILDKIEQEAHTYSEVTNVYTEDEVGAIIKTNTAVDLKTVINNVVEAQLQQIGG